MKRVFKFGGASVKNAEAVRNMAGIVKSEYRKGETLVIVVSAMAKTTNALEDLLNKILNEEDYSKSLIFIDSFHKTILNELGFSETSKIYKNIQEQIHELNKICQSFSKEKLDNESEMYDCVVSFGELISSRIIHAFLN